MSRRNYVKWVVLLSLLAAIMASSLAFAQGITISRPLDGATVRETVNVLIPISSVPPGGFISCLIDGKFRSALAIMSASDDYFVYRWDTKEINPDPMLTDDERNPRDGKHTITVQGYGYEGKPIGAEKTISVYVKNSASADMPASGLKLRYRQKVGLLNKYDFKYTLSLKSVEGATDVAKSAGEAVEGAEGTIKRSVEDIISGTQTLIRQKAIGIVKTYEAGQAVPAMWLIPKAGYHIEDSLGRITSVMKSTSPGTAVTIDFPNLPSEYVRIGDSWSQEEKMLRDAITGEAATFSTTSTLEGLEWECGYPCAKIRTTFSGTARIPFSSVFWEPMNITGETITYFAYQFGKIVASETLATATGSVDPGTVSSLTQARLSSGGTGGQSPPPFGSSGSPRMTSIMPSRSPVMSGASFIGATGTTAQTVNVKLELKQSVKLSR